MLSDQGYRLDGRKATEVRKVQARMGVFAQADGSAYLEQGNTKALAVVYGPHEVSVMGSGEKKSTLHKHSCRKLKNSAKCKVVLNSACTV